MTGEDTSSGGKRAVEFETVGGELHLLYVPRDGDSWIFAKFAEGLGISIKDTFFLSARHCLSHSADETDEDFDEWAPVRFVVAKADGEYFRFDREVLGLECDVHGMPEQAPSVITLNMRASSECVMEFIARAYPFRQQSNFNFARTRFMLAEVFEEHEAESAFTAKLIPLLGAGGVEPLLGLPVLGPQEQE